MVRSVLEKFELALIPSIRGTGLDSSKFRRLNGILYNALLLELKSKIETNHKPASTVFDRTY